MRNCAKRNSEVRISLDSEGRTIGGGKQCCMQTTVFWPNRENGILFIQIPKWIIHALGQSGHDRASDGKIFQYGIMGSNGGPFFDQNEGSISDFRVYLMGWLPESTITYDRYFW